MNSHLEILKKYIKRINLVITEIPYAKDYEINESPELNKHLFKVPPEKCPVCADNKFWLRVDGDYACMRCRPPLEDLVWEFNHAKK